MAEKIVYAALPKEDLDNVFDILEGMADLLDKTAADLDHNPAAMASAEEAADAIRLKIKALQFKVQIL